jgi:hypothetical protein
VRRDFGKEGMEKKPDKQSSKGEYIVLAVLLVAALLAFPAFRDVQLLQDFVIAVCAGIGLT